MTLRTNYIDIPIGHNEAGVAATTRYDFPAVTLIIPESPSRTFRSVEIELTCRGTETVATSVTAWLMGIKLGAVAFNDVTITSTIANTGEQQTLLFTRDVTSYFVTNFGTLNEQTCQVGTLITSVPVNNITARLRITYEYDDTEQKDSGTAESGTASTLTDTDKAWTTDAYKHWFVKITGGTGAGQVRKIASNTGTVLTITPNWTTNPSSDSTYVVNLGRVKTVAIPLDGYVDNLSNALVEIGTNQVPLLGTFLPEADKTFIQTFFEITVNEVRSSATDFTLELGLDAEAADADGNHESGLNSAHWYRRLWVRNDMTTSAVHAFKAGGSATACFNCLSAVLFVTYLYNHADSSTILNSLQLTMPKQSDGFFGGTAAGDAQRWELPFYVEEPATITLVQSGVQVHFVDHAVITGLNVRVGGQTYRAYTHATGSVNAGGFALAQRFDSGGIAGSGITLARGKNKLVVDIYRTAVTSGAFGSPLGNRVFLNYTSGKHSAGVGAHAHNTYWAYEDHGSQTGNAVFEALSASKAPIIPETNFSVVNIAVYANLVHAFNAFSMIVDGELKSGEGAEEGWLRIASATQVSDTELACYVIYDTYLSSWQRWTGDPDVTRMVIETARIMRANFSNIGRIGWGVYLNYHTITFSFSKTIAYYTGDGSGITVDIHRADTEEKVLELTTVAGGTFSGVWYDDTVALYAVARQSDTKVGRSANFIAGS